MFNKPLIMLSILAMLLIVAATGCSTLPASLAQAPATATPTATNTPLPTPTVPATATRPAAVRPNQPAQARLPGNLRALGLEGGVVASASNNSLGLKVGKSTDELSVDADTIIVVPGIQQAQVSDIHVGDRVVADVPSGDANAAASLIVDFPQSYIIQNIVTGVVTDKTQSGAQVRTRSGSQQVTGTPSTLIVSIVNSQPRTGTAADIKRGSPILVIGQAGGNSFTAQVVIVVDRATIHNARNGATPTPMPSPTATP